MAEKTTIVAVRIPESQVEAVDNWRRSQRKIPGLAEAVRTLINRGLEQKTGERAA
jgi:hypothetical protein